MRRVWGMVVMVGLVAVMLGCGGIGTSPGTATPKDDPLVKEVASHKFWKEPVSEADVNKMVATIQGLKQPDVFVVAASGKPKVRQADGWFKAMDEHMSQGRVVFVVMRQFASAPDRETILQTLKSQLDKADFRVGDGWLNPDTNWRDSIPPE